MGRVLHPVPGQPEGVGGMRSNGKVPVRIFVMTMTLLTLYLTLAQAVAAIEYHQRYAEDVQSILASRSGMQSVLLFIETHPEIFSSATGQTGSQPLSRQQRLIAWQTWQRFLDHILYLDSLGRIYTEAYFALDDKQEKRQVFQAAFACFLAQYRFALQYIEGMERNPNMHVILNEPVPELGMEAGAYALLKYRFLNVIRGAEFARLNVLYMYYGNTEESPLQEAIEEDIDAIWTAGRGKGPVLTLNNALKIVGDLGLTTWFPVQKRVSELMGDLKVWRPDVSLITIEQIKQLKTELRPGDILLQRREWYASNVGIPGFWTHAALYVGTPEERTAYFKTLEMVEWLVGQGSRDGTLESILQVRYPEFYPQSVQPQEKGRLPCVLEAIGKGVSFTTLEHSAAADSIAVLRPRLPKKEIAGAIMNAFQYSGRPYDFNFDFRTDSELVCSELVFKAYQKTDEFNGLSLPLTEMLGRPLISPNEIARLFDAEYGLQTQQLAFVVFLDGNEKELKAEKSSLDAFRTSWKRPKWYIWLQPTSSDGASPTSP